MSFKDQVKQWFKTGDKPTQGQFWQKFEWLRWKDEPIAMADVTDLTETLQGKADIGTTGAYKPNGLEINTDSYYDHASGVMLDMMLITPEEDSNILIGITEGGGEIYSGDTIAAGTDYPLTVVRPLREVTRIYFTNVTSDHLILIYTRSLSYNPAI